MSWCFPAAFLSIMGLRSLFLDLRGQSLLSDEPKLTTARSIRFCFAVRSMLWIRFRDFVGVADFSLPSRAPRFHVVNLAEGSVRSHWVAHGRGSDPAHTGWLERFSNEPHSNETSAGAYRTGALYVSAHGHSMRLEGLDPTNNNALSRAIVVHGAWYVNERVIGDFGMLGRSQGCFAVADSSLREIMARLGPGRLIYAGKA